MGEEGTQIHFLAFPPISHGILKAEWCQTKMRAALFVCVIFASFEWIWMPIAILGKRTHEWPALKAIWAIIGGNFGENSFKDKRGS